MDVASPGVGWLATALIGSTGSELGPNAAASRFLKHQPRSPKLHNIATNSGQDSLDHLPMHVGQAEVAAGVVEGELLVVEAEQVKDRGLEVVDVDRVLGDVEAQVVGGAVGRCRA